MANGGPGTIPITVFLRPTDPPQIEVVGAVLVAFRDSVQIQWQLRGNGVKDAAFAAVGAFDWKSGVNWPQPTGFTVVNPLLVTLDNNNNVESGPNKTVGIFDYFITVTYTTNTTPPTTKTLTLDPGIDNLPPGGFDYGREFGESHGRPRSA